jgi:hypothetical protein
MSVGNVDAPLFPSFIDRGATMIDRAAMIGISRGIVH